jgi:hypothetical protein
MTSRGEAKPCVITLRAIEELVVNYFEKNRTVRKITVVEQTPPMKRHKILPHVGTVQALLDRARGIFPVAAP